MLSSQYNPTRPYRFVRYGRMSNEEQNPRSPDQQFETIYRTIERLGYSWIHVRDFRDDGVSGKLLRKRFAFQALLQAIKSGAIEIDLIIVDTYERLGRAEEIAAIRRDLAVNYGVLIVTADSTFADPTSPQGQVYGVLENWRATEENRVKAHQVLRGKRDTARLGHWPGGKAPFGYRLQTVFKERNGRQETDYSILVPDPETAWIIQRLFEKAAATGWGMTRLAKSLNVDPEIPDMFKPFQFSTVGEWLRSPIYVGELLWEKHETGIINDVRRVRKHEDRDILRVPEFCEPLVERELWDRVQTLLGIRSEATKRRRKQAETGKQIEALAPGLALKYLLSGLVRCGVCKRAMTISPTKEYVKKNGESRNYTAYACPGYLSGACSNGRRVPEEWLRRQVVHLLAVRLFPNG